MLLRFARLALLSTVALACSSQERSKARDVEAATGGGELGRTSLRGELACEGRFVAKVNGELLLHAPGFERVLSRSIAQGPIRDDSGTRLVWTEEAAQLVGSTRLRAVVCKKGSWQSPRTVVADGNRPSRIAFAPDGRQIAYVSGQVASLWIAGVEEGVPQQLTNRGLEGLRVPGKAPAGYLPVPHEGPPRFVGATLQWTSPTGEHQVELP